MAMCIFYQRSEGKLLQQSYQQRKQFPLIGIFEAFLSDQGTNLLSMRDVCELLGVAKLNTTAQHPQFNGLVERFDRTLKIMLCKHVDKFRSQWDRFLPAGCEYSGHTETLHMIRQGRSYLSSYLEQTADPQQKLHWYHLRKVKQLVLKISLTIVKN